MAEVTSLPAASIGAMSLVFDFDNDGYGVDRTLGVSSIDDANSDFILDVLADENVPVIFGDDDTNGILMAVTWINRVMRQQPYNLLHTES